MRRSSSILVAILLVAAGVVASGGGGEGARWQSTMALHAGASTSTGSATNAMRVADVPRGARW